MATALYDCKHGIGLPYLIRYILPAMRHDIPILLLRGKILVFYRKHAAFFGFNDLKTE